MEDVHDSDMPGKPRSIGNLLGLVIDELGIQRRLDETRAAEAWPEVAGSAIGGATTSVWMRSGVLYVKVRSAVWRQELHLNREAWRERINRHLGSDLVREVRFC